MTIAVAHEGEMKWNGAVIALARDISLDLTKDALETTTLGVRDRTYVPGLRNATGSCTLLYDPGDELINALLNQLTANTTTSPDGSLTLNFTGSGARFLLDVILTNISLSGSAGDLVTAAVQFQVTGPLPTGAF